MKIYTKTGDDGTTSLLGGTRVDKADLRIECYGTVDELNAHVGVLQMMLSEPVAHLNAIQNRLFDIGSLLAAEDPEKWGLTSVTDQDISQLELLMDQMNERLPELKNFVLPGGTLAAAQAHVCRTVCRRAERRVVALADEIKLDSKIVHYLNRLSDWFFVLSRVVVSDAGAEEKLWKS